MCIEHSDSVKPASAANQSQKVTYSIKRALKQLFRQHKSAKLIVAQNLENAKKASSLESIESLENQRNADIESECASLESECASLESYENDTNEHLAAAASNVSCELEDYDFADISNVPVHFVRTAHGTFFWTAASELPADNDLIEPLCCSTSNQIAVAQLQDRWAQA